MIPALSLALTGSCHASLRRHLFPGDGLEAAAILLCSRAPGPRVRLLVQSVIEIPYQDCSRREARLTWPGQYIEDAIDQAEAKCLQVILLHSHPGGFFQFSDVDDRSDEVSVKSLIVALGGSHGSAIMTPDGAIRARLYNGGLVPTPIDLVAVAGDNLEFWWDDRRPQRPVAFGSAMTDELSRLSVAIIGVSGTGSIVAEQAARLGFGRILLVDFDTVERKNLNRILNATIADAQSERLKVDVFRDAIKACRGEGVVETIAASIMTREAVLLASQADIVFCCVDTLEARYVVDLVSKAFLLPLIDMGVTIPVRKTGARLAIADAFGRIDYVQPGLSSLGDRGVYTPEGLRAEYLLATSPESHEQELQAGYIKGAIEQAPSVITLNMRAASAAMNEFIARAFPFRIDPNTLFARTTFSLAAGEEEFTAESEFTPSESVMIGRGAEEPLLGLPSLGT